jgi:hypothetical protein
VAKPEYRQEQEALRERKKQEEEEVISKNES